MFAIVSTPIDAGEIERAVRSAAYGAVVSFLGVVRERADDGRLVDGLFYEAYEPMALDEFAHIAQEARAHCGDLRIAIVHRIGELRVGDIAVAVVASAPHRGAAFTACSYAVDELKSRAPIWKKERYRDGSSDSWRSNATPGQA